MFKIKDGILIGGKTLTATGGTAVLTAAEVGSGAYAPEYVLPATITNRKLQNYSEHVQIATVSTGAYNVDLSLANVFEFTLTVNTVLTFTNPPAAGTLKSTMIILKQDATGGRTCTVTNAQYTDGLAPQLSTGANQFDVLTYFTVNGGTTYLGTFAMANPS